MLLFRRLFCATIILSTSILLLVVYLNNDTKRIELKVSKLEHAQKELKTQLEKYVKIHDEIMNGKRPVRLIFSLFQGGYGNQINSVLSSLIIGIIHERAVLIHWPHIHTYMQETLKHMFINVTDTNVQSMFNPYYKRDEIDRSRFHASWQFTKTLKNITDAILLVNNTRIRYDDNSAYFMEICASSVFWERLVKYELVSREYIDRASLLSHSGEEVRQEASLRIGYQVGGELLRRFWRPRGVLQQRIDTYYNKFFKNNLVIGLQIRFEFLNKEIDLKKFINCALGLETHAVSNKRIYWFVASDSQENLNELKLKYPDRVVITNGTLKNIDPAINENVSLDGTGLERTILDSELLSLCDYLVITGGSTFGFVAGMKSGRLPYYLNGNTNQEKCELMTFYRPPHNAYAAIF